MKPICFYFSQGFPSELKDDVYAVLEMMPDTIKCSDECHSFQLINGQTITFPYRIYTGEIDAIPTFELSHTQKMIYHCILSRSNDGFVRQAHVQTILEKEYPDWVFPYLLKISDEYVVEVLQMIYDKWDTSKTETMKIFCKNNLQSFLYSHARMVSYWNEFYRSKWFCYKDYVGRKLFTECFGYTKSMEKERKKWGAL